MYLVEVLDRSFKRLAILENAYKKELIEELNGAGAFTFDLPRLDPKFKYIKFNNIIRIYKEGYPDPVFTGRIMPKKIERESSGKAKSNIYVEGYATKLMDKHLRGGQEYINQSPYTVYNDLLSRQTGPEEAKITVDPNDIEFTDLIPGLRYDLENLMASVWGVRNTIGGDIEITPDLKLKHHIRKGKDLNIALAYGDNIKVLKIEEDPSDIVTVLIPLGYGEGINQLNIKSVNNGSMELRAETIADYGEIEYPFIDRRYTDPLSLKKAGELILEERKHPRVTYEVDIIDLSLLTGLESKKFSLGDSLIILDKELGVEIRVRIVDFKRDLDNPHNVKVTLSNRVTTLADEIIQLKEKTQINESHPQGATNIYQVQDADNVDSSHPLTLKFFIPDEAININRVKLNFSLEEFRAYSKGAKAGGGSTVTAKSGGGATVTAESGGGSTKSTTTIDDHRHLMFLYDPNGLIGGTERVYQGYGASAGYGLALVLKAFGSGESIYTRSAEGGHSHNVTFPDHTHPVNTPDHTHPVDVPEHTHPIDYGIYTDTAPESVGISVNGQAIGSGYTSDQEDLNITSYITKGWNTVELTSDRLGRINSSVFIQTFIQSK